MRLVRRLLMMGLVVVLASGLCGCTKKDSGEKAGAVVDKAVQNAGAEVDKAVQNAGESVEKAGKEVRKSGQ